MRSLHMIHNLWIIFQLSCVSACALSCWRKSILLISCFRHFLTRSKLSEAYWKSYSRPFVAYFAQKVLFLTDFKIDEKSVKILKISKVSKFCLWTFPKCQISANNFPSHSHELLEHEPVESKHSTAISGVIWYYKTKKLVNYKISWNF